MNDFAMHLLSRHKEARTNIKPRLRGRFELLYPSAPSVEIPADDNRVEFATDDNHVVPRKAVNQTPASPTDNSNVANTPVADNLRPASQPFYGSISKTDIVEEAVENEPLRNLEDSRPRLETNMNAESDKPVRRHLSLHNQSTEKQAEHIISTASDNNVSGLNANWTENHLRSIIDYSPAVNFLADNISGPVKPVADDELAHSNLRVGPVLRTHRHKDFGSRNAGAIFPTTTETSRTQRSPDQAFGQELSNVLPVIKVTIGRIDVRAIVQAAPPPAKVKQTEKPKLSLEDYLKQRNNTSS